MPDECCLDSWGKRPVKTGSESLISLLTTAEEFAASAGGNKIDWFDQAKRVC
jgi:hypothetical protein